ncbi:MAG: lipopolysaccharide biosynthesis protein [Acidimicrobiales bacterium]|nr:lipopolysaccharide biosynthesis protein [Acidimicrobiales bacterium]
MTGRIRAQVVSRTGEQLWAMGLELATIVGTILAFMLLGRSLGVDGYSAYASLYAIISPLVTLSASGVVLAMLQHTVSRDEPLGETARSSVSIVLILGGLLTLGSTLAALLVIDHLSIVAIVSIITIELLTTPIVLVAATTVQAADSFTGAARIRLLLIMGRTVLLVGLFVTDSLTVANLGVAQLTWSFVLGAVALRRVGRRFGFAPLPGRIHARHIRTNLAFSAAISADSVGNDGDKVVLAANRYVTDTGLYAAAYRIVQLGMVPLGALANTTHVQFLRPSTEPRHYLKLALRYSVVALAYGVVFAIAVIVVAPLFPLLVGHEFEGSVEIVRWLSPIVLLRGLGLYSLNALLGLGRTGIRTGIVVANAAIGVVLFIVLIPGRGWEGAAIATLVTEAMQVLMTWSALVVLQARADRALDASEGDRHGTSAVP